jgi:hypothetical protein
MPIGLLRLPIAVGVLLTAIGVGTLVDGDVAGLAFLAVGLLLVGVPAAYLVRHLRAAGPADVRPSPAMADPALARDFGRSGTWLLAFGVPWLVAAFAFLVDLSRIAADDDASAGAIAGIMVIACVFAAIPALLGSGFVRAGRRVRRGSLDGIEIGRRLSRLVVVLGVVTAVLSFFDDRPVYRIVAVVAVVVVLAALVIGFRLRSLLVRAAQYETGAQPGVPAA